MNDPRIVSREEWLDERRQLLERERAFTRERDALNRARRNLPRVRVEKDYRFHTEHGQRGLAELFEGRSQLLVFHFMFGPDWDEGCPSCSFWADGYNGVIEHLAARDITLTAVSRAPLEKLLAYRARMGWRFPWVSSLGSDFNFDFDVSFTPEALESGDTEYNYRRQPFPGTEAPGASAFLRDEANVVFHTYATFARGLDMLNGAYHLMDIMPRGRDEDELPYPMAWVQRRDQY